VFKTFNNHSPRLMSHKYSHVMDLVPYNPPKMISPYRSLRLSVRHGDYRAYNTTDTILFAVWDVVGGLLLGATFFSVGFYLFQ
jgi:hypothetical protein